MIETHPLIKQFHQARIPHAIMLQGANVKSIEQFARAYAKLLLNDEASVTEHHPDLFVVKPEEDSKSIKVQQVRDLIGSLAKTPHQATRQVAIVTPADAMNIAAANALLKTLEEPSGDVVLLLVTAKPFLLPATIRSRCQLYAFASDEEVFDADDDFQLLTRAFDPVSVAQNNKDRALELLSNLQTIAMDILKVRLGSDANYIVCKRYAQELSQLSLSFDPNALANYLTTLQEIISLLDRHPGINAQLQLEHCLMGWNQLT